MHDPRRYFQENLVDALNLVDAMMAHGVRRIIFSSTCVTYGVPAGAPVQEDHPDNMSAQVNMKPVVRRPELRARPERRARCSVRDAAPWDLAPRSDALQQRGDRLATLCLDVSRRPATNGVLFVRAKLLVEHRPSVQPQGCRPAGRHSCCCPSCFGR
jgi:hypothetical protein